MIINRSLNCDNSIIKIDLPRFPVISFRPFSESLEAASSGERPDNAVPRSMNTSSVFFTCHFISLSPDNYIRAGKICTCVDVEYSNQSDKLIMIANRNLGEIATLIIISETTRSIRREIITLMVVCIAFVLSVSGVAVILYQQDELITEQRENAKVRVERISHFASAPFGYLDKVHLNEMLLQDMNDDEVNAIVLKGVDGKIIIGKRKFKGEVQKIEEILEPADIPVAESSRYDSHAVTMNGKPFGTLEIYINDKLIKKKLRFILFEEFAQAFIPLFAICIVLYLSLSKLLLSPLSAVLRMATDFGDGNFSARINVNSENEIGTLAKTFNRMADRIDEKISQLAAAEKKYRCLFESIQDVFFREDKSGTIQLVSPSIEKILGYSPIDVVGRNFGDFCILQGFKDALLSEVSKNGFVEDYDLLLRHKNGGTVPASINLHYYYDDQNEVIGFEGTFRDISERAHAFEEISHLKSSFADIIETLPSAIIVVDENLRIELMNRMAEGFCGFLLSQAKGVPIIQILPDFENELQTIPEIMFRKEPYSRERFSVARGFEQRIYDLQIYPINSSETSRAVIRFEDVTDKIRMQEALIQSEKMLMVGGLAAGTAHEINNPLAAIIQNAQNIERRISPDIPANLKAAAEVGADLETVRAYLEKRGITGFVTNIREGGARASKIIANMLQFSRKSDSRKELSDINAVLDQSLELATSDYDLRKRYDFRQVRIKKDFATDLPLISITVQEIEQVILNIVKNAAHAISESNPPDPCIMLRTQRKGDFVLIEIEDNGSGMTEIVKRRVFEPFYTTKDVGTGTGLGMSVSYTIITANHNGNIEVWSEPRSGARFTISLPIDKSPK
jgi:PAS domain S-box-containing protein